MKIVMLGILAAALLPAQWKLPASKVDLNGAVPKTADGKPDLSGIWEQDSPKYFRNLMADLKPEEYPYRPETKALVESRANGARPGGTRRPLPAAGGTEDQRRARSV